MLAASARPKPRMLAPPLRCHTPRATEMPTTYVRISVASSKIPPSNNDPRYWLSRKKVLPGLKSAEAASECLEACGQPTNLGRNPPSCRRYSHPPP
jgi:hypothetical protein